MKYRTEDGSVVNTEIAIESWEEATTFDGHNYVSKATGSQWEHEKLYRSRKGRYYVECWSQRQGSKAYAKFVDEREAARWLLANGHELPAELAHLRDEIEE